MSSLGRFGGRRLAAIGAAVTLGSGVASVGLLYASPALADTGCTSAGTSTITVTCAVGTDNTWTVPNGVTQATFDVQGAAGGSSNISSGGAGGAGGHTHATLTVTPNTTYHIAVASHGNAGTSSGAGAGGTPGGGAGGCFGCPGLGSGAAGGGGGTSVVATGVVSSDTTSWVLAAGGGGGGSPLSGKVGGGGGGTTGGDGAGEGCIPAPVPGGGQDLTTGSGQHLNGSSANPSTPGGGGGGGFVGGAGANGGCGGGGGSGFIATGNTGTTTTGGGSTTDGTVTITYTTCSAGQASHSLTASTNAGTITGLFCVNPSTGIGTYAQDPVGTHPSVSGLGIVQQRIGSTQIAAFGNNLSLGGQQFGTTNRFVESAPVSAIGTFSLS